MRETNSYETNLFQNLYIFKRFDQLKIDYFVENKNN